MSLYGGRVIARDLFGQDGRLPIAALRAPATPHQADLFTATAESIAVRTGRPASAIRIDLLTNLPRAGSGLRCIQDHPLRRRGRKGGLYCPTCDGAR